MMVTIKLTGLMARYYKSSETVRREPAEIPGGATVRDLLDMYGIPHKKAHIITINNSARADLDTVLSEGDNVWVLPLAHGG